MSLSVKTVGGGGGYKVGDVIPAAQLEEYRDPNSTERTLIENLPLPSSLSSTYRSYYTYERTDGTLLCFVEISSSIIMLYDPKTLSAIWSLSARSQQILAIDDNYLYRSYQISGSSAESRKRYIEKIHLDTGVVEQSTTITSTRTVNTSYDANPSALSIDSYCDSKNYIWIDVRDLDHQTDIYYGTDYFRRIYRIRKDDLSTSVMWEVTNNKYATTLAVRWRLIAGSKDSDNIAVLEISDSTYLNIRDGDFNQVAVRNISGISLSYQYMGPYGYNTTGGFICDDDTKLFVMELSRKKYFIFNLSTLETLVEKDLGTVQIKRYNPNTRQMVLYDSSTKTFSGYDLSHSQKWLLDTTQASLAYDYPVENNKKDKVYVPTYNTNTLTTIWAAPVSGYIIKEATE